MLRHLKQRLHVQARRHKYTDPEYIVHAVVNGSTCELTIVLFLFVVTMWKCSLNPIANLNHV
jgi:hypothetical protein